MTEPNRQSEENEERIIEIEIERLRPFKEHPFQVKDDKEMFLLQESIEKYGILNPLIVRPVPDGYYEIISGHRRKHAAEKLGYRKVPVIIRVLSEDDSILSIDEDRRRNATLLEDSFYNRKNLNPQIHDTEFFADLETWQRKQRRRGYSCAWHRSNIRKNRSKICVDFKKKIIDERKTTWYVFLKKEIILKANLLKGRVAKPEGTKVRKFDHVSRLPLFPYHHNIWKRCLNKRDSDTFYTI